MGLVNIKPPRPPSRPSASPRPHPQGAGGPSPLRLDGARPGSAGYFAFERLGFGQSIYLSAVYAALQAVPGVREVTITTFRQPDRDPDPLTVRERIFVRRAELAIIANDATDSTNKRG